MDGTGTRPEGRAGIGLAVAAAVLVCVIPAEAGAERATTSHIAIGLAPEAGFSVSVNGQPLAGGPFTSDELGVLCFEVDESSLPPGARTVVIGDPGDLVISSVVVDSVTTTSVVVEWSTNLPSYSTVEYGTTASYGDEVSDATLVTSHSVAVSGLAPATEYHFRVSSSDGQGHSSSSEDAVFETEQEPIIITGVKVDSVGTTWAAVSWQSNRESTSLVEYGETAAYGSTTELDDKLVTEHRVTVPDLAPGATYHFRVLSGDGVEEPVASDDNQFTTEALPDLAITEVRVLDTEIGSVTIAWATNRAASSLVEYGLTESYGSVTALDTTLLAEHEVTFGGLAPGMLYHFRVWSSEPGGAGICSEDHVFETEQAPLVLSDVTVDQTGQTWALVTWASDRPAVSWVDYGPTESYGETETPGTGLVTEHSATLSGLSEGALYHFRVCCEDENGMGTCSGDSTFQTMDADPTGPPQMGGVGYDVVSATAVLVTWSTDRSASSQVLFGTGGELDRATEFDSTEVLEHRVLVWPVVPRIDYTFVAVSACGCDTTVCEPMTFRSLPPEVSEPVAVPIDIIKVDMDPGESSIEVTWASDRPCSSWVEIGSGVLYEHSAAGVPLGESVYAATVEGLEPATTYSLRISGWDAAAGESVGDELEFETAAAGDTESPAAPLNLRCNEADGGVDVWWDPGAEQDLAGYNVYRARCRDGEADWSRAVVLTPAPIEDSYYHDSTTESGAHYEYAVTSVDVWGNESEYSRSVPITVSYDMSVLALTAYPNPMKRETHFAVSLPPATTEARLRIVSPSGRVVLDVEAMPGGGSRTGDNVLVWNGRDSAGWPVADGVYLCELVAERGVARSKLTVLR